MGIQREITPNTVLEVRYAGNHGTGNWRQDDINEVNIFENGFLQEFLNAFNNINFLYGGSAATQATSASVRSTSFGRITSAYQDISTTDDPGGRISQMVFRINF